MPAFGSDIGLLTGAPFRVSQFGCSGDGLLCVGGSAVHALVPSRDNILLELDVLSRVFAGYAANLGALCVFGFHHGGVESVCGPVSAADAGSQCGLVAGLDRGW